MLTKVGRGSTRKGVSDEARCVLNERSVGYQCVRDFSASPSAASTADPASPTVAPASLVPRSFPPTASHITFAADSVTVENPLASSLPFSPMLQRTNKLAALVT